MNQMNFVRLKDVDIPSSVGKRVYLIFLAHDIKVKKQKDGGEFISLYMVDKDKKVEAKIFDVDEVIKNNVTEGNVYEAIVDVKTYFKNNVEILSCIIADLRKAEHDINTFLNWVENLNDYITGIGGFVNSISETIYGKIVHKIIVDNWDKFIRWVAAKSYHHTELGALAFHTCCVTELSVMIGKQYQNIYGEKFVNMPLLISGAILHDIMKIKEYKVDLSSGAVEFSPTSSLTNHIIDIITEIECVAIEMGIKDSEEVQLLKHVVASHHSKAEWGSPIIPAIVEAAIVSRADELDAEMYKFNKDLRDIAPGNVFSNWQNGDIVLRYKEKNKV